MNEEEKNVANEDKKNDPIDESDDEDDCELYFLEPAGDGVDISEKIAEANKKLFEENDEEEEKENEKRLKRVQFSEDLVNFEPDINLELMNSMEENFGIPEDDEKLLVITEEIETPNNGDHNNFNIINEELTNTVERVEELNFRDFDKDFDKEEIDEIKEEINIDEEKNLETASYENKHMEENNKLLILLRQEHNSSTESIIGEVGKNEESSLEEIKEPIAEKVTKIKMARPKSASSHKLKKSCQLSKISPDLNYSSNMERTSWQSSRNIVNKSGRKNKCKSEIKSESEMKQEKIVKRIIIDRLDENSFKNNLEFKRCGNRPKSSFVLSGKTKFNNRPKTAPVKRTCCVIKSNLPRYNGFRSEYGLSADQLQERKKKTLEMIEKRKQDKLKEKNEEIKKKYRNEENFQKWLLSKSKKETGKKEVKTVDTLTRSDVYIQTHASYASNRNVPYSMDYNLVKNLRGKIRSTGGKKYSIIDLEKMFQKIPLRTKKCFNIFVGLNN